MKLEGLYGVYHLVYILISFALIITALILTTKKKLNEKSMFWTLKIFGGILLFLLILNRITVTKWEVENTSGYKLWYIFPDSWCSFATLVLSITLLCTKKENIVYHFCIYLNLLGLIMTTFIPTFLDQGFFDVRTLTGLLYHSFAGFIALFLLLQKYVHLDFMKALAFPVGMVIVMAIGFFEKYVVGYPKAMQIGMPFLDTGIWHYLSSWWCCIPTASVLILGFNYLYERFILKHTNQEIFSIKKNAIAETANEETDKE